MERNRTAARGVKYEREDCKKGESAVKIVAIVVAVLLLGNAALMLCLFRANAAYEKNEIQGDIREKRFDERKKR